MSDTVDERYLPVADTARVRRSAVALVRADGGGFTGMLLLNALAAGAGLVGPWLLGTIVDTVRRGAPHAVATVDRLALTILLVTVAQLVLSRYALYAGYRFSERTAARIRERFVRRALALPAAAIEQAATGDLAARGTSDVSTVADTLRDGAPVVLIAVLQAAFIIGAVLVVEPLLGACGLLCLGCLWLVARWYLRRARTAYLAQGATGSAIADVLATTATGARTVDALRLQGRRIEASERALTESYRTRMRTLFLRSVLFPGVDISYAVPVVGVLIAGGLLYDHHALTLGGVVSSALYLRQLAGPLDQIMEWMEQMQSSSASFARIEGLAVVPAGPEATTAVPDGDRMDVAGVRFAYGEGRDVLHGVDLTVRPGERLAVVGASGAGKSTLGRLLAGIERPREGTVTVGGVLVADLEPARLRRQVVLVTQEHHVFAESVRENLALARPGATDADLRAALDTVGAAWVTELDQGLDTVLGDDGHRLDGAQAQQLALARVVLADPHTIILDEATALLDPTTARHAERALAAVLRGRTVIAIAHRLQTAHDADRVAVMDGGRITELGTHDDLVRAGGAYASLWHSWHGDPR